MKTVAKLFLILSVIGHCVNILMQGFLSVLFKMLGEIATEGGVPLLNSPNLFVMIPTILMSVIGIVLSCVMYRKVKAARKASDISIGWKVVTLLFINLISGILLLVMKDKDYANA